MRSIDISTYEIVKAGVSATLDKMSVHTLIDLMQKNDQYVYWLQRKNTTFETQIPAVCVNEHFYHPSFKLEKAIFRHIRLTRNFQNYELLEDGTKKLRIPLRLWLEKQRTSNKFLVRRRVFAPCSCAPVLCAQYHKLTCFVLMMLTRSSCTSEPRGSARKKSARTAQTATPSSACSS